MIEEKRLRELMKNKGYVFFKNEYGLPDYFILNEKDFEIKETDITILVNKKTHNWYGLLRLTENLSALMQEYCESCKNNKTITEPNIEVIPMRVLLIEDGSVNEDELKKLNIPYLIYRQGATKPEIIEM